MGTEEMHSTSGDAPAQKVSVSLPADRVAAVRARVGKRGFSAYVSAAVERQLQRDLLEELLQEKEAAIGPVAPEVKAWAEDVFRIAEAKASQEERSVDAEGNKECHDHEACCYSTARACTSSWRTIPKWCSSSAKRRPRTFWWPPAASHSSRLGTPE
ncbi:MULTISPECIES: hypothetical protein [Streptomyces]|uniref:CopG family transcriptional regulator n=1 Tax=Streptomyces changanensis TaxID=2964669 RepID=A0ABY5N5U3_9ACTN|nr:MULTISPECIES: hypothetical protein [Streptomyces]UUS31895.1 hypothetical protein NRO40_14420 [Streptomyces changanensis]